MNNEEMKEHEEIKRYQRILSKPFSNLNPSEVDSVYWIYAESTKPIRIKKKPIRIKNSGMWLIFVKNENLDTVWKIIKEATEKNDLGIGSKTATMRKNPNARSEHMKVICVYTYDWEDEKDVMRVRDKLRELGIVNISVRQCFLSDEDSL